MNVEQLSDLVLQSLEHEKGGVRIYEAAIRCAVNDDLREEWEGYLAETRRHVERLEQVCEAMGLDPSAEAPSRDVVKTVGDALVQAIAIASRSGNPLAAQLTACEAVVQAETKDHADWELLAKCAKHATGGGADALRDAVASIEDEEDRHLYHSKGWCRELWLEALGLPAVLPPPEEVQHVKTAIGAAHAQKASEAGR
jgi:rubrerythrin